MSANVWGNAQTEYFDKLSPDKVLDACEQIKLEFTGRVIQLASMENRVYEVEIDNPKAQSPSDNFRILKFYRPGRWSKEQIRDEHEFLFDLIENDIHAIAPLKIDNESVFTTQEGLFFSIFPKKGGRACVEWTDDLLMQMGRLLARLHNIGQTKKSHHRLNLSVENFGRKNLELILQSGHLPLEYKSSYESICNSIFEISEPILSQLKTQRIHGDCHHGNILLADNRPFLIDFDDMSVGPRVQDIWMIIPGRDHEAIRQRNILLSGYESMTEFDNNEVKAIEILRSLRVIHFSAWIGHRYKDMSFQRAFPDFGSTMYWEKELFDLRQQLNLIHEAQNPYL